MSQRAREAAETRLPIRIVPVTRANWQAVIALRLTEAQAPNLASNLYSLAEAYVEPECRPQAVVAGETVIGFAMYEHLAYYNSYNIPRFMIDYRWQGRGYGRASLAALIEHLEAERPTASISISLLADNDGARALYDSLGFVDTGRRVHGEIVMQRGGS